MREADVSVLAVGFFDGVHLGHQAILRGADAALTFRSHPLSVLAPDRAPKLIMGLEERLAAIRACGVGDVVALDFTPELANMEPADFLRMAAERHPFTSVRCGANWRFGRGGVGDAEFLRARGIDVVVAPYVFHGGERVSSTRIRAALERGEIEDANAMMGRPFSASGVPFSGKGEGSRLGCPTLNLRLDSLEIRLPRGAYAAEIGGSRAVVNWGVAPTFGERAWEKPVLVAHFLGLPPDGVGKSRGGNADSGITVEFLRFLRPERKFNSFDALKAQIARDCEEALK